ncbi:MAG: hypothetical protein LCH39_01660 [Proteobacteria bacterium]|nr:hypothetical protein [Pseudomonadota bacterium]
MIDQLHAYPDQATAEAAFPRPDGEDAAVCWLVGTATVMPVTILLAGPEGPVAQPDYWLGVSLPAASPEADALWSLPSAQVELARAEGEPTHWLTCVTRSRVAPEVVAAVVGVTPLFAGSSYVFASLAKTVTVDGA